MTPAEQEKIESFYKWIVSKNPKIQTCLEILKAVDKFITYKIQMLHSLDSVKDKMDAEFASLIVKNFPEKDEE